MAPPIDHPTRTTDRAPWADEQDLARPPSHGIPHGGLDIAPLREPQVVSAARPLGHPEVIAIVRGQAGPALTAQGGHRADGLLATGTPAMHEDRPALPHHTVLRWDHPRWHMPEFGCIVHEFGVRVDALIRGEAEVVVIPAGAPHGQLAAVHAQHCSGDRAC